VFCAKNFLPNPLAVSNATGYAKFCSLWHVTVIETRAFPSLARRYPRDFTFYVADPISSIRVYDLAGNVIKHASQVASWIK
jgi:hypothetical protein